MNQLVKLSIAMMMLAAALPITARAAAAAASAPTTAPDKPKQDRPAVKAELKNLQGAWRIVRAENKGVDVKEKLGYAQFTVEGNVMRMVRNGEERKSTFELDPAHDPKWINFVTPRGDRIEGIYELSRDTWKTVSRGRGRPASLEETEASMFVYERVKEAGK